MSSLKMLLLLLILANVSACSLVEPFIDRRRNAGTSDISKLYVGRSTPQKPAVCSNNLWTTPEQIQALADAECVKQGTGTHAVLTDTSYFTCKLLLPTHTYFKCEK